MRQPHVLYRFFGDDGALLYIGITVNPVGRFAAHSTQKPWWQEVRRIDMECFDSREEVLAAEAAAIIAEHPVHNVRHNTSVSAAERKAFKKYEAQKVTPKQPLAPGQPVALCMRDGNCHVGMIDANDGTFLTITHKDWLSGFYWSNTRTVRLDDVVEAHHASFVEGEWRDEHFGGIQTRWTTRHRVGA